jgi:hypothetical protein
MLYIYHAIIYSLWLFWVIRKGKYSWHAIINAYCIFLLTIDAVETILSPTLGYYSFPAHLFTDPVKDGTFGFLMSDGIILPFTCIILCHYLMQSKKYWHVLLIFNLLQFIFELVYLSRGYLLYHKWNIGFSAILYFFGSCIIAKYVSNLMEYNPPMNYSLRLAAAIYAAVEWPVAILVGVFRLFEWKPKLFPWLFSKQPLPFIAIVWVLALLAAIIVPKTEPKYKPMVFLILAALTTSFFYFVHGQGWLIYIHWNHFLTVLRIFVPFILIIWYDRWERAYLTKPR